MIVPEKQVETTEERQKRLTYFVNVCDVGQLIVLRGQDARRTTKVHSGNRKLKEDVLKKHKEVHQRNVYLRQAFKHTI